MSHGVLQAACDHLLLTTNIFPFYFLSAQTFDMDDKLTNMSLLLSPFWHILQQRGFSWKTKAAREDS